MDKLLHLAGRILLSHMFILSGFQKVTSYADTVGYMASKGVPGQLLPLVILTELGGGLLILAGFQTRIVAILLAGFCIISALIFHLDPSNQMQMINFMKNFAIAGGFLILAQNGAPYFSIDACRLKSRSHA